MSPLLGETTLKASYLSTSWQIYEAMYLLLRVQGHSALHGGWDTDLFNCPLGSQTQQVPLPRDKYPTVLGREAITRLAAAC
jgi:hypothetical protein